MLARIQGSAKLQTQLPNHLPYRGGSLQPKACRIPVPQTRIEPGPRQWKPRILTTRPPGSPPSRPLPPVGLVLNVLSLTEPFSSSIPPSTHLASTAHQAHCQVLGWQTSVYTILFFRAFPQTAPPIPNHNNRSMQLRKSVQSVFTRRSKDSQQRSWLLKHEMVKRPSAK